MDEPVVSSPAADSLVKVTVIYQVGLVDFYVVFITTDLCNQTRALQLNCQCNGIFMVDKTIVKRQGLFSLVEERLIMSRNLHQQIQFVQL